MRGRTFGTIDGLVWALFLWAFFSGPARAMQEPREPQALARGPIHEAFAAPIVFNSSLGTIVPRQPPEPIEELPPEQKPRGGNVEWIPGYWAWDDERRDYLWISGIWRDIPPGRQWVSGYWSREQTGFRWVVGFWSSASAGSAISYLPPPPSSLEVGPSSPQPSASYLWSPGSWAWYENRYLWRPGFWVQSQPDWVWVPPTYVPTPGGYVFIDGYWDHPIEQRGVIFAPVFFPAAVIAAPAFVYTPTISLSIGGLTANLFVRPSVGAYYFGDYYGYATIGAQPAFVPWFSYQQTRYGYDPLYATMAANHWREPGWAVQVRTEYIERVEHIERRPAPTFESQRTIVERRRARGEDVRGMEIAHQAGHVEASRRFEPVRAEERANLARQQAEVRQVQHGRARVEAEARPQAGIPREQLRPQHLDIPRSLPVDQPFVEARSPEHRRPSPPAHPEGHEAHRPTFLPPPHQEPARMTGNVEPHRAVKPPLAHAEPRPNGGEPHQEPKNRHPEHKRP